MEMKSSDEKLCLCRAIRPGLTTLKIYGYLPITSYHDQSGNCHFKKSTFWFCYSLLHLMVLTANVAFNTDIWDILDIYKRQPVHVFLTNITYIVYAVYVSLVTFINLTRTARYAKVFNLIERLLNHGLLCQSALRIVLISQYAILATMTLSVTAQVVALFWLNSFDTTFDFSTFFKHFFQNTACGVYMLFTYGCSLICGSLACHQKLVANVLNSRQLFPRKKIRAAGNYRKFLGLFQYKLCGGDHTCDADLSKLELHELIEYMRLLHEAICVIQREINSCMNPQLLLQLAAELTAMVINYYAVVVYFVFDFTSPLAPTVNFLNCLYVFLHTVGLFIFLLTAQYLHNMNKSLISLLLEFSTVISTPEEHLQLRFFVEKLKLQRPFTASGIVTVDLSIAGSVCANILTYVLVALQFNVSKT